MTVKKKKAQTKKQPPLAYKDVMIMFLADGIPFLETAMREKRLKPDTARRACRALSAMSKGNAASFESWLNDHMPSKGRGRSAPLPGEERTYKAQQIKNGGAFLRLPLTPLGIKKGQTIRVRFELDRVVTQAA